MNNIYVTKYYNMLLICRSTDYGRTFHNEADKFPPDAVAHWYYILKDNVKVLGMCISYTVDCSKTVLVVAFQSSKIL